LPDILFFMATINPKIKIMGVLGLYFNGCKISGRSVFYVIYDVERMLFFVVIPVPILL